MCTEYAGQQNAIYSSVLLALYEHIHLGLSQSLRQIFYVLVPDGKSLSESISEVKKSDQWLGKYYCVLGRIRAKWGVWEQVSAWVKLGSSTMPRKHIPSFKLGNSASST